MSQPPDPNPEAGNLNYPANEFIKIDPVGDVRIMLKQNTTLQVSSKVLCLASKVFSAMLQPGFEEGTALAENGKCELKLPDDNVIAMHTLCLLLHLHHPHTIPYVVDERLFHAVAVLVDKYDCAAALYGWAMQQLLDLLEDPKRAKNVEARLLYASIVFDLPHRFKEITKRMVLADSRQLHLPCFHVPNWGLDESIREALPRGLLITIAYHEKTIKGEFLQDVEALVNTYLDKPLEGEDLKGRTIRSYHGRDWNTTCLSECDCMQIGIYLWNLRKVGLWPAMSGYRHKPLVVLLKSASKYDEAQGPRSNSPDNCNVCYRQFRGGLTECVRKALASFDGLCLDCVKHFRSGKEEPYLCRIKHEKHMGIMPDIV